jgi:hypothetical protein
LVWLVHERSRDLIGIVCDRCGKNIDTTNVADMSVQSDAQRGFQKTILDSVKAAEMSQVQGINVDAPEYRITTKVYKSAESKFVDLCSDCITSLWAQG